jgi:chromosome segregation ATPase
MKLKHFFLTALLISLSVSAAKAVDDGSTPTKTPEQIEAYKEEMRRLKQPTIEAYRQEMKAQKQPTVEAFRQQTQEQKQTRAQSCDQITARVENRINQYEQNHDRYAVQYNNMYTRINNLADKLEAKGCDVAPLRSDLTTLEDQIQQFSASYRVFISEMKNSRTYACDETPAQFNAKVQSARSELNQFRRSAQSVGQLFRTTFKPHFEQIRVTCLNQSESDNQ